jgi:3-(methylthio)propanoyl-CoA dehydrogenase
MALRLAAAVTAFESVVNYVATHCQTEIKQVFAGSVPYLKLAGIVLGGWQLARAAWIAERKLQAGESDADFYRAKIVTARFFADHLLVQADAYRALIEEGGASVLRLNEEQF